MRAPRVRAVDGHVHPDFHPVAAAFAVQLGAYPGGGAVCVYHDMIDPAVKAPRVGGGAQYGQCSSR